MNALHVPPIQTSDWFRKAATAINIVLGRRTDVPASATAPGAPGQIAYDADYIYVCTAENVWKRAALTTW